MQELKKIGVLSSAKIAALFGVVSGILTGIFNIALVAYLKSLSMQDLLLMGLVEVPSYLGVGEFLLQIIFQVVLFFVIWIIVASLYNVFTKWVGGVKFELGPASKKK